MREQIRIVLQLTSQRHLYEAIVLAAEKDLKRPQEWILDLCREKLKKERGE